VEADSKQKVKATSNKKPRRGSKRSKAPKGQTVASP